MAIDTGESPSGYSTSSSAGTSTSRYVALSSAATTPRSVRSHSPLTSLSLKNYVPIGCLVISLPDFVGRSGTVAFSEVHLSSEDGCLLLASLSKNLASRISQLATALWVRLEWGSLSDGRYALRVYVLPEDSGNLVVDRSRLDRKLQQAMEQLLSHLDTSPETWAGTSTGQCSQKFDLWATRDDRSLQYIFNTLPSPDPSEDGIRSRQARVAFDQAFYDEVPGLKVNLYPYQRRSVAAMISRETCTTLHLDPRLEGRSSPDGSTYYFNPRSMTISKQPRMYESSPSGILAEAMGHGKTVICLALILATRHHLPQVPPQYIAEVPPTPPMGTRTLARTAAIQAGAHALSIKAHKALQYGYDSIDGFGVEKLSEEHTTSYLIYPALIRRNRRTQLPPPIRKTLSSTTIVVVPRHLTNQWKSEIAKHTKERSLRVLYMLSSKKALLPACELMQYDIVLFSKYRFEFENRDGRDRNGRLPGEIPECRCPYIGATRTVNCTCPTADDFYRSPLRDLHWLRIIIDEGHEFATKRSNAVEVATRLVTAERRWVVSGTPAKDKLLGVEVESSLAHGTQTLATEITMEESRTDMTSAVKAARTITADRRRRFNREEEKLGAAKGIGLLASNFLNVHPWSGCDSVDNALWDDFVFRHEGLRGHTYSSFSPCLSRTLEAMVIRTRPDDLEVVLPPLHSKVVKLEPCFLDRLTMNMFLFVIASNAITSERTDIDYLFHPNSRGPRYRLVYNLRQSAFCWTGFAEEEVQSSIDTAMRYLDKPDTKCTSEDREALLSFVAFGRGLLQNKAWLALGASHEVGVTLDHWPEQNSCSWSLLNQDSDETGSSTPMTGLTQALRAQTMLDHQLFEEDPMHDFATFGKLIIDDALKAREKDAPLVNKKFPKKDDEVDDQDATEKNGDLVMSAAVHDRYKPQTSMVHSPLAPKRTASKIESKDGTDDQLVQTLQVLAKRKRSSSLDTRALPIDSPLAKATISATTSAKMSYLISRIVTLHSSEKILVFYDGNDVAWYIAQFLELLQVQHRIYAKGLDQAKQADYIVEFDRDESIRVLLIDIRCGALGLNINAASRIFFVNPPCRPYLEAQAKKRCHRIGQTKPVFVETLVLKDTIEEAMYERSQRMSHKEHQGATHLEDDDEIADIIKNARMVPLDWSMSNREQQYAKLEDGLKLQMFGREGRVTYRQAEAAAEQKTIKRRRLDDQARARNVKPLTA